MQFARTLSHKFKNVQVAEQLAIRQFEMRRDRATADKKIFRPG
jgi:hypothetical protein